MKLLTKIIILSLVVAPTSVSVVTYAVMKQSENVSTNNAINQEGDYYIMNNDNYTFKLNSVDLTFEITKGSQTWDSGKISPLDDKITSYRESFLTNAATIYSYNAKGGESNFSIFDSDHIDSTFVAISAVNERITAKVSVLDGRRATPTLNLSFNIVYRLMDDGLMISLNNIVDKESTNLLSKIVLYPGFGMSYQLNNGYFLVPDGSGALIDLSEPSHAQSPLQLLTYGKDIGIGASNRTYLSGDLLSLPMYAISDETKSMMVTISEGAEYSELNAKVMGMSDDYNAIYYRFIYRETTYQYMGISESNRKSVPQETANEFEPSIYYHLYDEKMSYSDIANKYRSYLLDEGLLNMQKNAKAELRLEFLMQDNKKALFGKEIVKMTTPRFIRDKVAEIKDDIKDLSISVKGYSDKGYDGSYPYSFPVSSNNEYKSLGSYLKDNNIDLHYVVDLVRSFDDSSNKLAMNMSQKLISSSDYVSGTDTTFYRMNVGETTSLIKEYSKKIASLNGEGFDFTSLGNELYSTYYKEKNSRSSAMAKYVEALNEVSLNKNMRKPNLYMFPYVKQYLEAPTSSSGYMIETSSIPFLSMVLSGYQSLYSSAINLNYLGEKQLLQLVDYNICPSYLLTEEDTTKLIDSPASSYIYSSIYDIWKDNLYEAYSKVVSILKEVNGLAFLNREMIAPNVYKNSYENDIAIIVNYSNDSFTYNGKEITSMSSEVIK